MDWRDNYAIIIIKLGNREGKKRYLDIAMEAGNWKHYYIIIYVHARVYEIESNIAI